MTLIVKVTYSEWLLVLIGWEVFKKVDLRIKYDLFLSFIALWVAML
jgi:hypothetical protein